MIQWKYMIVRVRNKNIKGEIMSKKLSLFQYEGLVVHDNKIFYDPDHDKKLSAKSSDDK